MPLQSMMFWRWLLAAHILLTFLSKQSASIHFFKSNCTDITNDINNILLIGMKRNHLLIIDKRFWVIEIEGTLFQGQNFMVFFHNAPVKMPLEKRYVEFQEGNEMTKMFHKVKSSIVFGWIWAEYNMTFAYRGEGSPNKLNYFIYDFSTNDFYWNFKIPNEFNPLGENKLCFVSSMNPNLNRMWVLKNNIKNGQILMSRFEPVDWYYLCQTQDTSKFNETTDFAVFLDKKPCKNPTSITTDSQTIRKCFQSHMDIFLIGDQFVYIIGTKVALKKGKSSLKTYQMKRKPINSFFVCERSIQAIIENNKILFYSLLCIILVMFGGLIYCFYRQSLETIESNESLQSDTFQISEKTNFTKSEK